MMPMQIARGDAPRLALTPLPSPICGVGDAAWTEFVAALESQSLGAVSDSNGYGCYEMRPQRLADLGYMTNLRVARNDAGRQVWVGDWVGGDVARERFLASPMSSILQYRALRDSNVRWIADGADRAPRGVTLSRSGVLAVLHRAGPGGLKAWSKRQYERTREIVARADGIF